jgi:hypothetical protein
MSRARRRLLLVVVLIVIVLALWIGLALNCPSTGIALTANARNLHRLKNRTVFPQPADFDPRVTLDAILQPGADRDRWSTDRAARIQGEVIDVESTHPEATNCYSPFCSDIHIIVARQKGVPKTGHVVVEVTPRLQVWAAQQGIDWSVETLQRQLIGHWCEFEGWLYFDVSHDEESENMSPGNPENWRATAWEIHPVTKITVLQAAP